MKPSIASTQNPIYARFRLVSLNRVFSFFSLTAKLIASYISRKHFETKNRLSSVNLGA
jgi:hypothetical protein